MNKLQTFNTLRTAMAAEYEQELRNVLKILEGIVSINGSEAAISFVEPKDFVTQGGARAGLEQELSVTLRDLLQKYVVNLRAEAAQHGIHLSAAEAAAPVPRAPIRPEPPVARQDHNVTRSTPRYLPEERSEMVAADDIVMDAPPPAKSLPLDYGATAKALRGALNGTHLKG